MKRLLVIAAILLSKTAFGFELSHWNGVWERFDDKGQLVERIDATESVPGTILTSKVEYFADKKSVAKAAGIMSKQGDDISFSFHVSGGTVIQAEALSSSNDSVLFKLDRQNKSQGQKQVIFTRFTHFFENGAEWMRQDLYSDEAATNQIMSVMFKKVS